MIQDTSTQDRTIERKKGWSRRSQIILASLAAVLIIGVLAYPRLARWSKADFSFDAARLNFATVNKGDLVRELGVEGKIVASSYPTLYSPAEGTVTLLIRAGETVERDQVLARVDSPELSNMLLQELSQVESLGAEYERMKISSKTNALRNKQDVALKKLRLEAAKRAMVRASKTHEAGLMGTAEFEKAEDDVRVAELELGNADDQARLNLETMDFEVRNKASQLERGELVLDEMKRRVAELEIRSPVNGVVGNLEVDPRDLVKTNQPLLTVIDLSAFEVEISIPENYADEVATGISVEILYENNTYTGMVSSVTPEVNGGLVEGSVVFTAGIPSGLKQNQRVNTRILLDTRPSVLKVRRGPFLESGSGRVVYVVRDGVAHRVGISIGATSITEVEIQTGVNAGDKIVISDTSRFENAETVLLR